MNATCPKCGGVRVEVLNGGEILCKNPQCLSINIPHEEAGKILQTTVESSCLPKKLKGGID